MVLEVKLASPTEEVEVVGTACCPDKRMFTEGIEDDIVGRSGTETAFSRVRVPEVAHVSGAGPASQLEGIVVMIDITWPERCMLSRCPAR